MLKVSSNRRWQPIRSLKEIFIGYWKIKYHNYLGLAAYILKGLITCL